MKFIKLVKANAKYEFLLSKLKEEIEEGDPLDLLIRKVVTKEDGELFEQAINKVIEPDNYSFDDMKELLDKNIVNKQDKKLFKKIIDNMLNDSYGNACDILLEKIVDRRDGNLFKQVLKEVINQGLEDELLDAQILTKDELEYFKNNL